MAKIETKLTANAAGTGHYYVASKSEIMSALSALVGFEVGQLYAGNGDVVRIFPPKAPRVQAPRQSAGPAPRTDDYQYCEVEGVKYRWRAGMADWQAVPVAAPPPPKPQMKASPPPAPMGAVSRAAVVNAARRKTRAG